MIKFVESGISLRTAAGEMHDLVSSLYNGKAYSMRGGITVELPEDCSYVPPQWFAGYLVTVIRTKNQSWAKNFAMAFGG